MTRVYSLLIHCIEFRNALLGAETRSIFRLLSSFPRERTINFLTLSFGQRLD